MAAERPGAPPRPETRFRGARADRAWWVNAANAALGRARRFVSLEPESLIRAATRRGWPGAARRGGHLDPEALGFRAELFALCEDLERHAKLHFVGRVAAREDTVRLVRTQLRVRRALAELPEEAGRPLLPPVVIVGWPRTGSTHLLGLLAQDPAHRPLPFYESFDPVPPPSGRDDRAARTDRLLKAMGWLSPHYHSIHPMAGADPEECVALFMIAFRTLQFDFQYDAPGYTRMLLETDSRPAYRFHAEQLRLLQATRRGGDRWLLKDPCHLIHLDALLDTHPDARIVFTHRDPRCAIGSICSLYAHTRAIMSDAVDARAIGHHVLTGHWATGLPRALAIRDARPAVRFADVFYDDLVRDPLKTVEQVYAALDLDFTDVARAGMERYAASHPQHPQRVHRYSLGQFGLRNEDVVARFADYVERFDIAPETPPPS